MAGSNGDPGDFDCAGGRCPEVSVLPQIHNLLGGFAFGLEMKKNDGCRGHSPDKMKGDSRGDTD